MQATNLYHYFKSERRRVYAISVVCLIFLFIAAAGFLFAGKDRTDLDFGVVWQGAMPEVTTSSSTLKIWTAASGPVTAPSSQGEPYTVRSFLTPLSGNSNQLKIHLMERSSDAVTANAVRVSAGNIRVDAAVLQNRMPIGWFGERLTLRIDSPDTDSPQVLQIGLRGNVADLTSSIDKTIRGTRRTVPRTKLKEGTIVPVTFNLWLRDNENISERQFRKLLVSTWNLSVDPLLAQIAEDIHLNSPEATFLYKRQPKVGIPLKSYARLTLPVFIRISPTVDLDQIGDQDWKLNFAAEVACSEGRAQLATPFTISHR